jgi:hypothetical protein
MNRVTISLLSLLFVLFTADVNAAKLIYEPDDENPSLKLVGKIVVLTLYSSTAGIFKLPIVSP